jgi:metal-responsive CopG/Arc/MetJ family transcriptional regulator
VWEKVGMTDRKGKYTTISIPRELYARVEDIIQETGFRSPTEYIVYLTRQAVAAIEADRQLIYSLPYMSSAADEKSPAGPAGAA